MTPIHVSNIKEGIHGPVCLCAHAVDADLHPDQITDLTSRDSWFLKDELLLIEVVAVFTQDEP